MEVEAEVTEGAAAALPEEGRGRDCEFGTEAKSGEAEIGAGVTVGAVADLRDQQPELPDRDIGVLEGLEEEVGTAGV